jgi:hypothetical protein
MLGLPSKMEAPKYTLNNEVVNFTWQAMQNVSSYELWMED